MQKVQKEGKSKDILRLQINFKSQCLIHHLSLFQLSKTFIIGTLKDLEISKLLLFPDLSCLFAIIYEKKQDMEQKKALMFLRVHSFYMNPNFNKVISAQK